MLDVIGAGATASSTINWYDAWKKSEEAASLVEELDHIHADGRSKPAIAATRKSDFATSWFYQVAILTQRTLIAYWRNPTYIMAKLMLNIAGGLFIGFTFFKAKDTLQGTQNKLFVRFLLLSKHFIF